MQLWVNVLKPFGYHDDHSPGEQIKVSLYDINELIKKGYVEIIVNNMGNNIPYDEKETSPFIGIQFHDDGTITTRKD